MSDTIQPHPQPDSPAPKPRLFPLGMVCATPGALDAIEANGIDVLALLARHQTGDWGDLCAEDRKANGDAVRQGSRVFSAYCVGAVKLWVITEYDRSVTTILLPEEY